MPESIEERFIDYVEGEADLGTFSVTHRQWPRPCSLKREDTTPTFCQWCGWSTVVHQE